MGWGWYCRLERFQPVPRQVRRGDNPKLCLTACLAVRRASGVRTFREEIFQDQPVERLIGDELLELAVFVLHEAEPFGVADFEAAELVPPPVEGGLTDAVAAVEFGHGRAGLVFFAVHVPVALGHLDAGDFGSALETGKTGWGHPSILP